MKREIQVKFTAPGFHRWPSAPPERGYLSSPHRHLFHITVTLGVIHNEREVEFHDLLDLCRKLSAFGDHRVDQVDGNPYIAWSCETHAEHLLHKLIALYPSRTLIVTVSEDDECAATLTHTPQ